MASVGTCVWEDRIEVSRKSAGGEGGDKLRRTFCGRNAHGAGRVGGVAYIRHHEEPQLW